MLENYAKSNHFLNTKFYVDDGYSGTSFNRLDFNNLKSDIDNDLISTVIVKDLSRFGRDYLQVGMFTEHFFPDNDIRFIAIEDAVDSGKGGNEFMPFRNIMNEWYARDVSKKIRAGYKAKSSQGLYTGSFAPYGYKKDPTNKHRLLICDLTATIVKQIFEMSASGLSIHAIANHLKQGKIPTPREAHHSKTGKFVNSLTPFPHQWSDRTVHAILQSRVYIGHMVSQKTTTKSYKSRKTVFKDKSKWIEVKNTHEPIIPKQLFKAVQKEISVKRREHIKSDFINLFADKISCGTCGKPLNLTATNSYKHFYYSYCRRFGKMACSSHAISYGKIYDMVLNLIKDDIGSADLNSDAFMARLQKSIGCNADNKVKSLSKSVAGFESRIFQIDSIICKLYEDNVLGKITDAALFALVKGTKKSRQN